MSLMKKNGGFCHQLRHVAGAFDHWDARDKILVVCALAKKVPWPCLKLLQRVVDATVQDYHELDKYELDANNEQFLSNLISLAGEDVAGGEHLRYLIQLVPFLRADNVCAKNVYLSAAPALVMRYIDASTKTSNAPELFSQLLTYLLIHPALTVKEQRIVAQWLYYFETNVFGTTISDTLWQDRDYLLQENNIWDSTSTFRRTIGKNVEFRNNENFDFLTPIDINSSFSKNGKIVDMSSENDNFNTIYIPKTQRSNSLTPSTDNANISSSIENLFDEPLINKPRSLSLSSENSLSQMRPMMYVGTVSETSLDEIRQGTSGYHPGMAMVGQWLKTLRLHKYVWLFKSVSYSQMMSIDDEYLSKLGVTTGARHKILLSIKRLNDRKAILDRLESQLHYNCNSTSIAKILDKLRSIFLSPLPPMSDIPASIVRILEIASMHLTGPSCQTLGVQYPSVVDDVSDIDVANIDPLSLHCWLVEKALNHELFSSPALVEALKQMRHRLPPKQFYEHVSGIPQHKRNTKPRWRVNPNASFQKPKRAWGPLPNDALPTAVAPLTAFVAPNSVPNIRSLSPSPSPSPGPFSDYTSLHALCLQMTEQAIN